MPPGAPPDRPARAWPVFPLIGDVDIATAAAVTRDLDEAIADARDGLIVDLSQVTFLDATGLRVLLETQRHGGDRLRLRRPSRPVTRLLELTGLVGAFSAPPGLTESAA